MRVTLLHHLYGRVLLAQGLAMAFVLGSAVRPGVTLAAFSASSVLTAEVSVADLTDAIVLRALPLPPAPRDLGPPEPPEPPAPPAPREPESPGPPETPPADKPTPDPADPPAASPSVPQADPSTGPPAGPSADNPEKSEEAPGDAGLPSTDEAAPSSPETPAPSPVPSDPPSKPDRPDEPSTPQPPSPRDPHPPGWVPPLLTADFDAVTATLHVAGVRPGRPVLVAGGFLALAQGALAANPNPGWQVRPAASERMHIEVMSAPADIGDGDTARSGIAVGVLILMPPGTGTGTYQGEITVSAANGWTTRTVQVVVQVEPPGPPTRPDPADPPGHDRRRHDAGPEGPSKDDRAEGPRRSGHEDPTADQVAPAPGEAGEADLGGESVRDSRHADPRLHDWRVHEHGGAHPHPDEHR
ncbi:MAG: hypothetical protein ACM3ZA_11070 [Bacillota bacterium]